MLYPYLEQIREQILVFRSLDWFPLFTKQR